MRGPPPFRETIQLAGTPLAGLSQPMAWNSARLDTLRSSDCCVSLQADPLHTAGGERLRCGARPLCGGLKKVWPPSPRIISEELFWQELLVVLLQIRESRWDSVHNTIRKLKRLLSSDLA